MDLNSETLAKALSRKPVKGYTPGSLETTEVITSCGRAFKINEKGKGGERHGLIACIYDDNTSLNSRAHNEHAANARLFTTSPDLQDENQVLQAAVRRLQRALENAKDQHYPGCECEACKIINTALILLPTEGESDD